LIASRACGGRGSVGARGAGRAGSPCEPETRVQTNGAARLRLACKFPAPSTGPGRLRRHGGPCVRQNRVVLAVVATVKLPRRCERAQPGRLHHAIRGAREARRKVRLPGEHGISRPTTAQGRPSDWPHLYAAVRFFLRVHFRAADRGCEPAPGLPCALLAQEGRRVSKARANCAARARRYARRHTRGVIARFNRAIQYSRDARDQCEKPRRTGFPAFAGNDSVA